MCCRAAGGKSRESPPRLSLTNPQLRTISEYPSCTVHFLLKFNHISLHSLLTSFFHRTMDITARRPLIGPWWRDAPLFSAAQQRISIVRSHLHLCELRTPITLPPSSVLRKSTNTPTCSSVLNAKRRLIWLKTAPGRIALPVSKISWIFDEHGMLF